jgi:hypothetical protein
MIEMTAMMRRNSTSRRVQALSSGSIRSDDIAATDIALSLALSRPWSRAEVSDMEADLETDPEADLGSRARRVLE